jgi:hypothetical protein
LNPESLQERGTASGLFRSDHNRSKAAAPRKRQVAKSIALKTMGTEHPKPPKAGASASEWFFIEPQ